MTADDDNQQTTLRDPVVALLPRLGQPGYAVREELGEDRLSRFDTVTE